MAGLVAVLTRSSPGHECGGEAETGVIDAMEGGADCESSYVERGTVCDGGGGGLLALFNKDPSHEEWNGERI